MLLWEREERWRWWKLPVQPWASFFQRTFTQLVELRKNPPCGDLLQLSSMRIKGRKKQIWFVKGLKRKGWSERGLQIEVKKRLKTEAFNPKTSPLFCLVSGNLEQNAALHSIKRYFHVLTYNSPRHPAEKSHHTNLNHLAFSFLFSLIPVQSNKTSRDLQKASSF